jgi:Glycosyl hydrolases family 31
MPPLLRRLAVALALLLVTTAAQWHAALASPADPDYRHNGVITDGALRVEVLTPTLLRLEYAADGHFEDRPTFNAVDRTFAPPHYTVHRSGGTFEVRTNALTLHYKEGAGPVSPTTTSVVLKTGTVQPAFGSPAHPDALGGWFRGLDYYAGQAGPIDQIKLHQGMLNRSGWYLLDDTTTAVATPDGWTAPRPAHQGAYQDGYLFGYGHDYKRALADLNMLTGPADMLPKWAFGNWFSEYNAFTAAQYENELIPAFRANKVPIDALVTDTDWKAPNTWAGWNWNPVLFPDPQAYLN